MLDENVNNSNQELRNAQGSSDDLNIIYEEDNNYKSKPNISNHGSDKEFNQKMNTEPFSPKTVTKNCIRVTDGRLQSPYKDDDYTGIKPIILFADKKPTDNTTVLNKQLNYDTLNLTGFNKESEKNIVHKKNEGDSNYSAENRGCGIKGKDQLVGGLDSEVNNKVCNGINENPPLKSEANSGLNSKLIFNNILQIFITNLLKVKT